MAGSGDGSNTASDRLGFIDGLRGIAVLSVMLFHARVHSLGTNLDPLSREGSHGVDLFFVLSGFCLALPTLQRLRRNGCAEFDLAGYVAKRCLRILPPYVAAVGLIAAAGWYCMAHALPLPAGMPRAIALPDVLGELFFLDRHVEHINASFWSLAVEFRWYFLFPLLLVLWTRSRRSFLAVFTLVVVASELTRATSTDLGVMPAFLLGIVAAGVYATQDPILRRAGWLLPFAIGFALLNEIRPHFPIQTNVGWHIAAFFFVLAAAREDWLRLLLAKRPLAAVGIASYSIYLVHEPVVSAVVNFLQPRVGEAAGVVGSLGAGLAAGFALWLVVERQLTKPLLVAAFVTRTRAAFTRLLALADAPSRIALQGEPLLSLAPPAPKETAATVIELASVRQPGNPEAARAV